MYLIQSILRTSTSSPQPGKSCVCNLYYGCISALLSKYVPEITQFSGLHLRKHRQPKPSIPKMPVIIKIDTSSNQVIGSAGEHIRLP